MTAKIVGFHAKNTVIANSKGEIIESPPYLKGLLQHSEKTIQTFYHMESCVESLLSILGIQGSVKDELLTTTKLCIPPYKYRYIPDKFFSIKRNNHHLSYFCNMSQYFLGFDNNRLKLLDGESDRDYCLRIANEAKKIGVKVYSALSELGMYPTSLTSLSRIYELGGVFGGKLNWNYEQLKEFVGNKLVDV
jgi:hypothetical protein